MSEEREKKDAADDIAYEMPQPMYDMPNPSKYEQPRGKYEMPQGKDVMPQPEYGMPQGSDDGEYEIPHPQGKDMPHVQGNAAAMIGINSALSAARRS